MKKYTKDKPPHYAMDFIRHMRRSAFFPGRPGGLITEITWNLGRLEVICEWRIFFNAAFERRELAGIKEGRRDEK